MNNNNELNNINNNGNNNANSESSSFSDYYEKYLNSRKDLLGEKTLNASSSLSSGDANLGVKPNQGAEIKPEVKPEIGAEIKPEVSSILNAQTTPVSNYNQDIKVEPESKYPEQNPSKEPELNSPELKSADTTNLNDNAKPVPTDIVTTKSVKTDSAKSNGSSKKSKVETNAPSVLYTVSVIVITVVLCFGAIYAGAKWGLLNGLIKSDIEHDYSAMSSERALNKDDTNPQWEKIFATVNKGVVSIQITTNNAQELGTGFVYDNAGHIITNNHVVADAADSKNAQIAVTSASGRIFDAEIVGRDELTDLAVIKLKGVDGDKDLTSVTIGNSDDVTVGDKVMAVGNPLGLANTATSGIVSALDRPVAASSSESSSSTVVNNTIQIDAAINPGNSGGPLFDAAGKVIGVNSSIAQTSEGSGSVGLGFSIPINTAKTVVTDLIESGEFKHSALGVSAQSSSVTYDGANHRATKIVEVSDDAPASGVLQNDDYIIAVNKKPVISNYSLISFINTFKLGTKITLTIIRDGSQKDVEVTLDKERDSALSKLQTNSNTKPKSDGGSDSDQFDPFEEFFNQR